MAKPDEIDRVAPFIREYGELQSKGFPPEQTEAYKARVAGLPEPDRNLIQRMQATLDAVEERRRTEDPESRARKSDALAGYVDVLNKGASEEEWRAKVATLPEEEQHEVRQLSALSAALKRVLNRPKGGSEEQGASR